MLEGLAGYFSRLGEYYSSTIESLPPGYSDAFSVVIFAFFITVAALFVWRFYNTLSQKDFIDLNLKQYNRFDHPTRRKFFAVLLYLIENIIIMPILIMVWFVALSVILLIIATSSSVSYLLLLTASLVVAVRFLSYVVPDLSRDLAKLFPFIALSVFLLSPSAVGFESLEGKIAEVPSLFENIFFFFATIVIIEVLLRIVTTIAYIIKNRTDDDPWSLESYGYATVSSKGKAKTPEPLPDGDLES